MFAKLTTTDRRTIQECLNQAVQFIQQDDYYPYTHQPFGTGLVSHCPEVGLKFKEKLIEVVTVEDLIETNEVGWTTCRDNKVTFTFFKEGEEVVKVSLELEGQRNALQFLSREVTEGVWEITEYRTHAEFLHPFETLGQWIARNPSEVVLEVALNSPELFSSSHTAQKALEKLGIGGHSQARLAATFNSEELKIIRKLMSTAKCW
jgi:hypothetical protein